jgi:ankyrin repeat protein
MGSRFHETPLSHNFYSFELSWDNFCSNVPSLAQFHTLEPSNSFGNLDLPVDYLEPDKFASLDTNLATIPPLSWVAATQDAYRIPDFLTSMTPMFTRILPIVEPFMRSMRFLKEDVISCSVESFYHANTSQLLRKESVDLQILHVIFYRLVNDDNAIRALTCPRTNADKLLRVGVEHIFSLGARLLGELLDSAPPPYRLALEQGLFRAAIEMGAGRTLQTILERDFNPNRPFSFGSVPIYPLERTCHAGHLEATRILLEYGADPNEYAMDHPLAAIWFSRGANEKKDPTKIQLVRLLLSRGVVLNPGDAYTMLQFCESEAVLLVVSHFVKQSYELFIRNDALGANLVRIGWDHHMHLAMKAILEQDHPIDVQDSESWHRFLTTSLYSAALKDCVEAIEFLLARNARLSPDCLIGAVWSKNMNIVTYFLDLGLDPNTVGSPSRSYKIADLPSSRSYGIGAHNYPPPPPPPTRHTALGESIEQIFSEAFVEFSQRGFLSQVAETEDGFRLALIAACTVGDDDIVRNLLSLRKLKWTYTLGKVVVAAVRADQEAIVEQLLSAGIVPDSESLFSAVRGKHLTLTKLLVNVVELNKMQYPNPIDILFEAIKWGNLSVISVLVHALSKTNSLDLAISQTWDVKGSLNSPDLVVDWIATPLSAAILNGNRDAIELLLASRAPVNVREVHLAYQTYRRWARPLTALTACVFKRDLELLQDLLYRDADPSDNNAIYIAVAQRQVATVKMLLHAFAQRHPYGVKAFGSEALAWAARVGDLEMLEMLVQVADVTGMFEVRAQLDESKWVYEGEAICCSPLGEAIRLNSERGSVFKGLTILLHHFKDPNAIIRVEGSHKLTPLLYAIELESLEIVRILINAGADKSLPALWGVDRTPLQAAAEIGSKDIVEYLLELDVDANEAPAPRAGATALQLASIKGFISIAKTLLDKGANVNAEPAMLDGRTAFEGATEHGCIEMMLFLVQNGADILSNDGQQYRRAIQFAELNGQHAGKEFAEQLFEMATRNNRAGQIGGGDFTMTEFDACNFEDLFPHD